MLKNIVSGGTEIIVLEEGDIKLAMPKNSLVDHIFRHPDIAKTEQDYLNKAINILRQGKPFKNGFIYNDLFLAGYPSQEVGCYLVTTVHRR
jgi:hypothetical protein